MELIEKVKKEIRSLLLSQKGGCTIAELQRDYRNFNGRDCPFSELGFRTFREFIDGIPDVARSSYENGREVLVGVTTEETAHIAKMIAKQKGVKKKGKRSSGPPSRRSFGSSYRSWSSSSISSLSSLSSQSSSHSMTHRYSLPHPQRIVTVSAAARHQTAPSIPQSVQRRIADVAASFPNGCTLDELQSEFTRQSGGFINFKHLGFANLMQLLASITKYVTLRPVPGRGYCVFPVAADFPQRRSNYSPAGMTQPVAWKPNSESRTSSNSSSDFSSSFRSSHPMSRNITNGDWGGEGGKFRDDEEGELKESPLAFNDKDEEEKESVRSKVWKLLENKHNGVWAARLAFLYRESYGHELPFKLLGYDSAHQFFKEDNNFWRAEQPIVNGDCIVFPNEQEDNEEAGEELGVVFHDVELPSTDTEFIYVYVCHSDSPDSFFVQLHVKRKDILSLGDRLQEVCSRLQSFSELSPKVLQPGLACCAMFSEDNMWYRARVVSVAEVDVVTVFFVDYGNTEQVPVTALKKIEPSLCEIPAQAVHCKLGRVEPVEDSWSNDAVKRFRELTVDNVFVGMDWSLKDGMVTLSLCDTQDQEKDVYIHHILVSDGFGKYQEVKAEPKVASGSQETSAAVHGVQNLAVSSTRQLVKRVQLTDDHVLHIINHLGTAYVMGSEVVSWLWPNDPEMLLTTKLEEKRLIVKREVLSRRAHKQLFETLESDFGRLGAYLTVFVLTGVPEIIATFGNPYSLLFRQLEKEIEFFDSDPYWTAGDNSIEPEPVQRMNFGYLSHHEMCLAHQALEFRRNSLLKDMVTLDHEDSASAVDELVGVERQIAELKQAGEERLKSMTMQLQAATISPVTQVAAGAHVTDTFAGPGRAVVNPAVTGQLEHQMMANHGFPYHGLVSPVTLGRGTAPRPLTTSHLLQGPLITRGHGAHVPIAVDPWRQGHQISQSRMVQTVSMESPFTDPEIRSVGLPTLTASAVGSSYPFGWNVGNPKL